MNDSHNNQRKPRLERRNAMKNIDYQLPFTHLSPSLLKQTTFRIHGNEEFHHIFQSLGLSGPEDFSIPTAAWEQSQRSRFPSSNNNNNKKVLSSRVGLKCDDVLKNPNFHQSGVEGYEKDGIVEVSSNGVGLNRDVMLKNSSFHQIVVEGHEKKDHGIIKVNVFSDSSKVLGGGGGIKGVRPPVLEILDYSDNTPLALDEENEKDDSDVGGQSEKDSSMVVDESIHYVSPNGSFRTTFSSWQKGEILGKGSFGTVYEGFTDDGIFFAVKEVSLVDEGSQAKQSIFQLQQEISLLSQFKHENIVRYFGTDRDNNMLYIFLELVTKGSLASLYQKYRLRDSQVSAYTRQILSGLKYLHDRNVVHRDIKCANILVDANGSVKLADFGLAKATKLNDVKSSKGSPYWMAPEVVNLRNHGYGLAADIWSLGCTVLEMLTRQPPYSHLEGMQALFRIGRGQPPPVPETMSKDARDFILKCLQVNPSKRPTSAQLLDHPFVKRPLLSPMSPISPRVNLLMSSRPLLTPKQMDHPVIYTDR